MSLPITDGPALFDHAGLELPELASPSPADRIADYMRRRTRRGPILLTPDQDIGVDQRPDQPCLAFPRRATAPHLVPQESRIYLSFGVYDTFRDLDAAASSALALEGRGVRRISDLVDLTETDVRGIYRFVKPDALEAMKSRLAAFGLFFRRPLDRRIA